MQFKNLEGSDSFKPNKECSYDHCEAQTPFGRFLLTWKSWKCEPWQNMGIGFDETPWGDVWYEGWTTVEEAKQCAEQKFQMKLLSMFK